MTATEEYPPLDDFYSVLLTYGAAMRAEEVSSEDSFHAVIAAVKRIVDAARAKASPAPAPEQVQGFREWCDKATIQIDGSEGSVTLTSDGDLLATVVPVETSRSTLVATILCMQAAELMKMTRDQLLARHFEMLRKQQKKE